MTIADHLLGIQDPSGAWLADQPPHITFDQTAEIAIWLQEISAELGGQRDETLTLARVSAFAIVQHPGDTPTDR